MDAPGKVSVVRHPPIITRLLRPLLPLIQKLFLDIGQKPHEASSLYSRFYGSLLFGGEAGSFAALDTTVWVDELPQEIDVFVIDVTDIILG